MKLVFTNYRDRSVDSSSLLLSLKSSASRAEMNEESDADFALKMRNGVKPVPLFKETTQNISIGLTGYNMIGRLANSTKCLACSQHE